MGGELKGIYEISRHLPVQEPSRLCARIIEMACISVCHQGKRRSRSNSHTYELDTAERLCTRFPVSPLLPGCQLRVNLGATRQKSIIPFANDTMIYCRRPYATPLSLYVG